MVSKSARSIVMTNFPLVRFASVDDSCCTTFCWARGSGVGRPGTWLMTGAAIGVVTVIGEKVGMTELPAVTIADDPASRLDAIPPPDDRCDRRSARANLGRSHEPRKRLR